VEIWGKKQALLIQGTIHNIKKNDYIYIYEAYRLIRNAKNITAHSV